MAPTYQQNPDPQERKIFYIGMLIGLAILALFSFWAKETFLISPKSRFSCAIQADSERGVDVYAVMYRHDSETKPWLRMINTLGGGYTPQKRCLEIADRMEKLRKEGLRELTYRSDPNTEKQWVICAKTKQGGDSCELVLTLQVGVDPYEELQKVAGALLPGGTPSYQCSNPANCPAPKPLSVPLKDYLAKEDREAGD
jgi:hypothetical protein